MSTHRPYVRSMDGWWKRNAYYLRYMAREMTAVFVAAYAVVLLVGVIRLGQGEAAFNGWLQALQNPLSLVFHLVVLATFVYHTWSWFNIMPITMPMMFVGRKRVPPGTITGIGLVAAVIACAALFVIVRGTHA
jgi:fumarate reductase subunit C